MKEETVPPLRQEMQPGDFVCDEGVREWCSPTEEPCPICGHRLAEIHVEGQRYRVVSAFRFEEVPEEMRLLGCTTCQVHFTAARL